LTLYTNTVARVVVGAAGNVSIALPSSGFPLSLTGPAGSLFQATDGTNTIQLTSSASTAYFGSSTNTAFALFTDNTPRLTIAAGGAITVAGNMGVNGVSPPAQLTGWGTPAGPAVVAAFPATPTLAQCGQAIGEIIVALKNFGLFGA
jgi:hypothetical protein